MRQPSYSIGMIPYCAQVTSTQVVCIELLRYPNPCWTTLKNLKLQLQSKITITYIK